MARWGKALHNTNKRPKIRVVIGGGPGHETRGEISIVGGVSPQ